MLLFDIGANIGRWAIANQDGNTVISVEASPTTYQTLVQNTSAYPNITCISCAVSPSSADKVEFFESNVDTLSTLDSTWLTSEKSRFHSEYHITRSIFVPTITIDKLIEVHGMPDILKLDVEGAENIVIQSLTKKAKTICVEWASEWDTQTKECIDHIVSLGYTKFYLQFGDEYTFRPSEYPFNADELWESVKKTKVGIDWGMIWCA